MIEPYVIDQIENDRREHEESLRVPLHITPPTPPPPPRKDEEEKDSGGWSVVVDFEV